MEEQLNPMTFPLNGARLIEASAGTGKTYTIAALYLRLVLGHGNKNGFARPLTPPEILVVTFTNAATEELRERIRSRLTEAAGFFRGTGEADAFLEELKGDYDPGEWPAMAMRLEQAAQWMDESAIHTIHAWCQCMLRQHAFDSLSLFDLELAPNDQDLLEEAACDFWRAGFYPQSVSALSELKAVAKISTPQELLKQVFPIIDAVDCADGSNTVDPFDLLDQRIQSIESARLVWASEFDRAVEQVTKAQADKTLNNNKYRKGSLEKWIVQLDQWVNHGGPLPENQVLEKFSTQGLTAGKSKNNNPPTHPAYDALDVLNEALASKDVKQALIYHAAAQIRKRVAEAKDRLSRMGFNDLLTRLGQALSQSESGGNRLARVIRDQFPVAMIDEFQDTDPVQYSSFAAIYQNRENTGLFMIGDPKQAIYAFRGADIHTYLKAKKDTLGHHYTLGKNYRSTHRMVEGVNQVFGWASHFPDGPFLFKDQIPFDSVKAQGRQEQLMVDDQEVQAMTLWLMEQGEPVNKTGPEGYITRMAQAGAQEIARLISLGRQIPCRAGFAQPGEEMTPLRPSDIAVLVRDGREAAAIQSALTTHGIKSVYLSDKESVFDSPEAQSLLYILQACSDPTNDTLVRTALATQIIDLSFETLDRLEQDELAREAELERFKQFQNIWHYQGVLPMVRALLLEFNVGARMLAGSTGERRLTNVLHLAEIIQVAAADLDGEQGIIRWLAGQIENPKRGGDDQILRLESDQALVRVVTIHKSKGLEYPLVFLPFICSFRKVTARNSSMVKIHDKDGNVRMVVNPGDNELEMADQERLAEDLRILYVALTRACHACWLGMGVIGKVTKKGETTDLHQSGIGYLLKGGEMIPTVELPSVLANLKGDCDTIAVTPLPDLSTGLAVPESESKVLLPARTFNGIIPKNWRISSYSGILTGAAMPETGTDTQVSLKDSAVDSPDSPAQDQLQETAGEENLSLDVTPGARSIHTFARGPEPGTFLHDMLEWAAHTGFDQVAQNTAATRDKVTELCIRRGWDLWSDVLSDWFLELIQTPLPLLDDSMALSDLGPELCKAEMEFLFAAHQVDIHDLDRLVTDAVLPGIVRPVLRQDRVNGMLKGFIDLLFRFDNRYFVLDYKSNYLGENQSAYGQDAMAQAMVEHRYDLQYLLYILALHRLLKARIQDYDYERDVGGAVYLFLRGVNTSGQGIYVDKPPATLINELDNLFKTGNLFQKGGLK
ncbi:exodeoxyribonuclease V subunit beta [Desulfobacter hydrogenophilus]|uniref:DNA 3'-5' helicase n=1 Tax=Desulfobacter hydrogenophilus TaxID=2291 RepID=A0A328FBN7_9BACT|nr:exodeoxyribonuclease V subunit beta [Desulfobacter hydrogenophilus]NDY73085.1 exodeoxyribonuclease V subunit beta [Desulfobacter hydrogenophilus]QBH13566.1 exodeoxyribonuclease V subunit beta [Desulfobacter hydrogenophilus]RAM01090.1 exodeoxyribonuclease V subunit beta [Desulfobacter hydrogenophilus]